MLVTKMNTIVLPLLFECPFFALENHPCQTNSSPNPKYNLTINQPYSQSVMILYADKNVVQVNKCGFKPNPDS